MNGQQNTSVTILTTKSMAYIARPMHASLTERGVDCGNLLTVHYEEFADGEFKVFVPETVRNTHVYFIHSFYPDIHRGIWQLFQVNDALLRADAASINNVLPYLVCARQDRKKTREPVTSALLAYFLQIQGVRRIFTLDVHAEQIQGFFRGPFDNLFSEKIFIPYFLRQTPNISNVILVAADIGGAKRVRSFARNAAKVAGPGTHIDFGIIDKDRVRANEVESMTYLGPSVAGKNVWMVEDMIDTGTTALKAGALMFEQGAASVTLIATHGIFSPKRHEGILVPAEEKFAESGMQVVISETIPRDEEYYRAHPWLGHLPIDRLFTNATYASMRTRDTVSGAS